ncbi:MAG: hypothetical protein LBL72_10205 [Candidatus Accumulibacter sp.]|jgi:hypothetical protein|nr:hypothetical protein [Accumulibacter sp.]
MFLTGVKSFLVHYALPIGLTVVLYRYYELPENAPFFFIGLLCFADGISIFVTCGCFDMPFWVARTTRIIDGKKAARKYPLIYFLAGVAAIAYDKFA